MDKKQQFIVDYVLKYMPSVSPMEDRKEQIQAIVKEAAEVWDECEAMLKEPEPEIKRIQFNNEGDDIEAFYKFTEVEIEIVEVRIDGNRLIEPNDYVKLLIFKKIKSNESHAN